MMKLLGIDTNQKTIKGQKMGYMTGILYLSPSNISGKNLCPHSSAGCRAACLNTAGRGKMNMVQNARLKKTQFFLSNKVAFVHQLTKEIAALEKRAAKKGMKPCVRLNGTSDIPWENLGIIQLFPNIQFYDYTPSVKRMTSFIKKELPKNYHLTFSKKENNQSLVELVVEMGGNVAVVFANDFPKKYLGKKVVNGDESDLRFLDGKKVIVGLKAKGRAKKDSSGFVVNI
jgi:putative transposon-encoded protein